MLFLLLNWIVFGHESFAPELAVNTQTKPYVGTDLEGCRISPQTDFLPQSAHHPGASNALFRRSLGHHLAKLHAFEVSQAGEYLEVT